MRPVPSPTRAGLPAPAPSLDDARAMQPDAHLSTHSTHSTHLSTVHRHGRG